MKERQNVAMKGEEKKEGKGKTRAINRFEFVAGHMQYKVFLAI